MCTTPILSLHMGGATTNLTVCCIILHNMGVSNRIIGDVYTRYDPPSKVVDNSGRVSHGVQDDAGVDNRSRVTAPGFSSTETNKN
jgi:hypothetical protein